jgi:hypothetical protein
MLSKQFICSFVTLIVIVIGHHAANGQTRSSQLSNRRITIEMDSRPLYDVLIKLIYVYDVPVGFEESTLDSGHDDYFFQTNIPPQGERLKYLKEPQYHWNLSIKSHLISLNYKNQPLSVVLDDLVRQMENYSWKIEDDVVNIFPKNGRNPLFAKLLSLQIDEFQVGKGAKVGAIQPALVFNSPGLSSFLKANGLFIESFISSPRYLDRPLPVELSFSNISFKKLLNGITRAKRGGWIIRSDKRKAPENHDKDIIEIII